MNHTLPVLSHVCSILILLARVPIKLTLFFAAFGMTEEFWPLTHSPMLLLPVTLHQADRLFTNHNEYLPALVRLLVAMAFDKIKLIDWILIFVLAALWHYTARPSLDNRAAWKVIRRREKAMADRVIAVMDNFCSVQASVDRLATEWKTDGAGKDEASTTSSIRPEGLGKSEGHGLPWIVMDNAPPLDENAKDPGLVPLPPSPFLMKEGIFRALRCDSMAIILDCESIGER